jgi:hypothetical protein
VISWDIEINGCNKMQVKTNKDLIINDLRISNLVMKRLKSNEIRDFGLAIKVEDSVTMNQGWRRGLIREFLPACRIRRNHRQSGNKQGERYRS